MFSGKYQLSVFLYILVQEGGKRRCAKEKKLTLAISKQ